MNSNEVNEVKEVNDMNPGHESWACVYSMTWDHHENTSNQKKMTLLWHALTKIREVIQKSAREFGYKKIDHMSIF